MRHVAVDQTLVDAAGQALGLDHIVRMNDGGQKAVARATASGEECVLKVVLVDSAAGAQALMRAQRETEILSEIDSKHVVKLSSEMIRLGDPVEAVAWTEEYLDGDDLVDLLGSPWDWSDVEDLIRQVATGLEEFHSRKVAHRDLSPKNLRRRSDGTWVIIDPGLARFMNLPTVTQFGAHPGTPGFMSPEHVSHVARPTEASDVFGIGILARLCLTGTLPIPFGGDVGDYVSRLQAARIPGIRIARPDLSDDAVELVDRMLHPHPARRFIDATELLGSIP